MSQYIYGPCSIVTYSLRNPMLRAARGRQIDPIPSPTGHQFMDDRGTVPTIFQGFGKNVNAGGQNGARIQVADNHEEGVVIEHLRLVEKKGTIQIQRGHENYVSSL